MGVEVIARINFEAMKEMQREGVERGIRDVADLIFAESQDRVPVDNSTLKKSGNVRYDELSATVGYATPYAFFVHEGTAAHDIYPKNPKGVLKFETGRKARLAARKSPKFADIIFARHAHHPGTRAQPFLRDAVEAVKPFIPDIMRAAIRKAMRR